MSYCINGWARITAIIFSVGGCETDQVSERNTAGASSLGGAGGALHGGQDASSSSVGGVQDRTTFQSRSTATNRSEGSGSSHTFAGATHTFAGSSASNASSAGGGAAGALGNGAKPSTAQPGLLSQTGLYEPDMKTLRSDVAAYTPRFELWSDSASKQRWLYLPPAATIDTSDPDFWIFPVGTKVWKEFSKNGKRIETRLIERVSTRSYRMMAYLWREDLSDAVAVEDGQKDALGTDHDVPSATDCETCHVHQPGRFAGLGTIQLDHQGPGLTLTALWEAGRLSTEPPRERELPGDPTTQAAIGILHSNCGICHNPNSTLPYKALDLWQRVGMLGSVPDTNVYQSTVRIPAGANPDGNGPPTLLVPGDPESSALIYRMRSRIAQVAMPPLASNVVDEQGVQTVSEFVRTLK